MWSVVRSARLIFVLAIGFGMTGLWQMHSATMSSVMFIDGDTNLSHPHGKDQFRSDSPRQRIDQQEAKKLISKMTLQIETLNQQVENDHKKLELTQNALAEFLDRSEAKFDAVVKQIADLELDRPSNSLKLHIWDDSTHQSPREDILVAEGWFEYNGKALGDTDDASTPPLFVRSNDPSEADFIVWATVMARHELEVAPLDPLKHAHKAIVLDYSDGCTIQQKLDIMRAKRTELGYFKRSYVGRGDYNSFRGNCTSPDREIFPYSYSGARAMMIPLDSPMASVNFEPQREDQALVYGKLAKHTNNNNNNNNEENNGYFQDQRYENFLVPFRDRKWTLTNVLRHSVDHLGGHTNAARNHVIHWTKELAKEKAGDPRTEKEVRESPDETNGDFTAYIGGIDNKCDGYCFGPNYFRHLRDAKIIVSCNPAAWEGDFRLWESFLSGAMIMVDKMTIPEWMPNPPQVSLGLVSLVCVGRWWILIFLLCASCMDDWLCKQVPLRGRVCIRHNLL
jgi:hypothetical protein